MDIPNCYDPVYQAERLAMEENETVYCSICESPISPGRVYHEHLGTVVCTRCLEELTKNAQFLDYE